MLKKFLSISCPSLWLIWNSFLFCLLVCWFLEIFIQNGKFRQIWNKPSFIQKTKSNQNGTIGRRRRRRRKKKKIWRWRMRVRSIGFWLHRVLCSISDGLDLWKIIGVLVCRNKTNPVVHFLLFFGFFFCYKMRNLFPRISFGANRPFSFLTSSSHDGKLKRGKKKGSAAIFSTRNEINWTPRPRHLPIRPTTHTPRTLPEPRSRPRYSSAASSRVCYFCAVFYLILFLGTRRINLKITHFEMFIVCVVTILESVGGLSSPPPYLGVSGNQWSGIHQLWWYCGVQSIETGDERKEFLCVCVCVCGMMMWSGEFRQPDTVLFVFFVY